MIVNDYMRIKKTLYSVAQAGLHFKENQLKKGTWAKW